LSNSTSYLTWERVEKSRHKYLGTGCKILPNENDHIILIISIAQNKHNSNTPYKRKKKKSENKQFRGCIGLRF